MKNIGSKEVLALVLSAERNGKQVELSSYIFIEGVHSINIVHSKRSDSASMDVKNNFFNSLKITE